MKKKVLRSKWLFKLRTTRKNLLIGYTTVTLYSFLLEQIFLKLTMRYLLFVHDLYLCPSSPTFSLNDESKSTDLYSLGLPKILQLL